MLDQIGRKMRSMRSLNISPKILFTSKLYASSFSPTQHLIKIPMTISPVTNDSPQKRSKFSLPAEEEKEEKKKEVALEFES